MYGKGVDSLLKSFLVRAIGALCVIAVQGAG